LAVGCNGHGANANIPFIGPASCSDNVPIWRGKTGFHTEVISDRLGDIHVEALHFGGCQGVGWTLGIIRTLAFCVQEGLRFIVRIGGHKNIPPLFDRFHQIFWLRGSTPTASGEHEHCYDRHCKYTVHFLHKNSPPVICQAILCLTIAKSESLKKDHLLSCSISPSIDYFGQLCKR
jgi:hypothetical protein